MQTSPRRAGAVPLAARRSGLCGLARVLGRVSVWITTLAPALQAISARAMFFGGLTHIGSAPNMMLRAIAAHRGVRMPGFIGCMLWSNTLLLLFFCAAERGVLQVLDVRKAGAAARLNFLTKFKEGP